MRRTPAGGRDRRPVSEESRTCLCTPVEMIAECAFEVLAGKARRRTPSGRRRHPARRSGQSSWLRLFVLPFEALQIDVYNGLAGDLNERRSRV